MSIIHGNQLQIRETITEATNIVLEAARKLEYFKAAIDIMDAPDKYFVVDSLNNTLAPTADYKDSGEMGDTLMARIAGFNGLTDRLCLAIVAVSVVFIVAAAAVAVVAVAALGIVIWREMALWEEYGISSPSGSQFYYEQTIDQIMHL